ncbi:MAG TPA: ABC transporter permease [Anaeromyxobacteraceae bacterium]|nr:ABC transporter permease [Anaeromyxobacteraceae bacterium]
MSGLALLQNVLSLGVPFSVALLLAALGESVNQRAGVFNLGCEGIMSMGAFLAFLPPWWAGAGAGPLASVAGFALAGVAGALLGALFAVVTVTFRAPQGIAGIGLQMLGWGTAGTLFRHYVGGVTGIEGVAPWAVPGLSRIPVLGPMLFSHNPVVYLALAAVPATWWVLHRTTWGLRVRAVGTQPRAADSMGIDVVRVRYQALLAGGAMAGLGGAYLSLCQARMFADDLVAGRGFIAVALVYFGRWSPFGILGGALLFSLAQALQLSIQVAGIKFPYEFAVMLPYALVIVVLALARRSRLLGPTALGKPYDRELRV